MGSRPLVARVPPGGRMGQPDPGRPGFLPVGRLGKPGPGRPGFFPAHPLAQPGHTRTRRPQPSDRADTAREDPAPQPTRPRGNGDVVEIFLVRGGVVGSGQPDLVVLFFQILPNLATSFQIFLNLAKSRQI